MRNAWITYRGRGLHLRLYERDAPAVVFVHGLGFTAAAYEGFCARLADEDLSVIALDLQGHGLSDGRRGHLPFRDAIGNIRETVAFARARSGGPVGVCGSGLGGILALYAAIEDDDVAAVAAHTAADLRDVGRYELRWRQRALVWLVGRARAVSARAPLVPVPLAAVYRTGDLFDDPARASEWRRLPRAPRWYSLETLASIFLTPDDKPDLASLSKPVFIVTGSEDRIVPLHEQETVAARIGAELFVLPGAGHMLPIEHIEQTAPRIGQWMRKELA